MNRGHLDWPFFDAPHRALAESLADWSAKALPWAEHADVDAECRRLVRLLGDAGWLRYCVPAVHGGALPELDARSLCVARETLAWHDGLADFAFAMQGLGSGAITLAGSAAQKARWLPQVARGTAIAAFALSEPGAGSDVAAMTSRARRDGAGHVLDGGKTFISNGGIADFYCVFARTGDAGGTRDISAFVVPADAPGLIVAERIETIAPHPLARLEFNECRIGADALIGGEGEGFKLAMQTLDIFRVSVAAAALGFARRALAASVDHARSRPMFGGTLADLQLTQATLADMATAIDAAVQLHGGLGVTRGQVVERLYREIRALRIYEGATEVQKLIVARELLNESPGRTR
jgi:acyl-CoA dehydrogenase